MTKSQLGSHTIAIADKAKDKSYVDSENAKTLLLQIKQVNLTLTVTAIHLITSINV